MGWRINAEGSFVEDTEQHAAVVENEATLRREVARMNHENEDMKKRLEVLMEELRFSMDRCTALQESCFVNKAVAENYKQKYESLIAETPKKKVKKETHKELPGQIAMPLE